MANTTLAPQTYNGYLQASSHPVQDINRVAYQGQDPLLRMYRPGYEHYMAQMPQLHAGDPLLLEKVNLTRGVMQHLANQLRQARWVANEHVPAPGHVNRTLLALEAPIQQINGSLQEGKEIVLVRCGDGFTTPVHGHADGYLHHELLYGLLRVNTYRQTAEGVVRPLKTEIFTNGLFANGYTHPNSANGYKRQNAIHSFTSIGYSAMLGYSPEHTRDGRDNTYEVEYFEQAFQFLNADLRQLSSYDAMYLRPGDVLLVRSANVPEYGDHYMVVTGAPIMKNHGLRPQEFSIYAPNTSAILDKYEPNHGLTLLKLQDDAQRAFHEFHGITMQGRTVVMPQG